MENDEIEKIDDEYKQYILDDINKKFKDNLKKIVNSRTFPSSNEIIKCIDEKLKENNVLLRD